MRLRKQFYFCPRDILLAPAQAPGRARDLPDAAFETIWLRRETIPEYFHVIQLRFPQDGSWRRTQLVGRAELCLDAEVSLGQWWHSK